MSRWCRRSLLWLAVLACAGCKREEPPQSPQGGSVWTVQAPDEAAPEAQASRFGEPLDVLEGRATYYSDALRGRSTASGEPYDPGALTAAHRSLPFGTQVRVVRADSGRSVVVRINDRGPFGNEERILDLSRSAAERLDMIRAGVVRVRAEVLEYGRK
jgi:rare lipoprotein A